MCGFNFILDKKCVLDDNHIIRMNTVTRHRGPDHTGYHTTSKKGRNFFFAASRLKIMDLSDNANQPIVTDDGNYVLVFNGEIYNYHDIKNNLLHKGYTFKSSSDSEVLLYALIEYGEDIIGKLNGMFAFIFFDRNNDRLLFSRDRFGMKPLFYFENELFLIISSEIKGILTSGLVKKELDEKQIPYYLKFRFARKPDTFFKNIFELEEGRSMCKSGDTITVKDYTSSNQKNLVLLSDDWLIEKTDEIIYDAFLRHTIADAPLGLFLSGGVDSTLLLAMAQRERKSIPTFSIVHEEKIGSYGTEDGRYSRLAVEKFGSSLDHHEITASPDILEELDEMILKLEQPVGDSATLLTWYLSRYSKNMVKTVLSGAGADELFAGYNRHWAFFYYLKHYDSYRHLMGILRVFGKALPTGFDHPFRKHFRLVRKYLVNLDKDPGKTFTNFTELGFNVEYGNEMSYDSKSQDFSISQIFNNALQQDRHNYLISDVLALNDQMAMAHGLEMRMPYLDQELTDFILSIDPLHLIKNGRKWILKSLLTKMGGSKFCKRPKEGFGLPFGHWIRMKETGTKAVFNEKQEIIDKFVDHEQIRKMYHNHMHKKGDHTSELWSYLILAKWLKLNDFT